MLPGSLLNRCHQVVRSPRFADSLAFGCTVFVHILQIPEIDVTRWCAAPDLQIP